MHRITGLNILLVEDEAYIALDVKELLRQTKCKVVGPFVDVATALAAIEKGRIDCAILDVNLGKEHTLYLADVLADRAVPFIWMSGYDATILPERHRQRPFVAKPFAADDLYRAVADAVAQQRPRNHSA